MRSTTAAPFAVIAFALAVAACGGTAAAAPPASERPATTPTAAPSQDAPESPAVDPTPVVPATPVPPTAPVGPADQEPEPEPQPTDVPAEPRPSQPVTWSDAERALLDGLRVDAQVNCSPRRSELPEGATAGIECRIGSTLVERVGVYAFDDLDSLLSVYLDRLAGHGVEPRSGACGLGEPGDSAWTPGDEEGQPLTPLRDGCFHDEDGTANLRIVCGDVYIGVLGATADIAALHDWAAAYDESFPGETPSAAGICYGPADAWH